LLWLARKRHREPHPYREEIYSLAAREIEAKILKEKLINKKFLLPSFLSDDYCHPANASGFARRFCGIFPSRFPIEFLCIRHEFLNIPV